jgi:hypothetical protein
MQAFLPLDHLIVENSSWPVQGQIESSGEESGNWVEKHRVVIRGPLSSGTPQFTSHFRSPFNHSGALMRNRACK